LDLALRLFSADAVAAVANRRYRGRLVRNGRAKRSLNHRHDRQFSQTAEVTPTQNARPWVDLAGADAVKRRERIPKGLALWRHHFFSRMRCHFAQDCSGAQQTHVYWAPLSQQSAQFRRVWHNELAVGAEVCSATSPRLAHRLSHLSKHAQNILAPIAITTAWQSDERQLSISAVSVNGLFRNPVKFRDLAGD
jgi:hypothetical protein